MIKMINGKAYDVHGAYKREILGTSKTSIGLCYTREGNKRYPKPDDDYGFDCKVLASSVEVTPDAQEYINSTFSYPKED